MIIENNENKIRKIKADEGFVIVSKQKVEIDNKGRTDYAIKSKEIYLGVNDSFDNYIEIKEE